MGKLLDEIMALAAVTVAHLIEVAVIVALYIVMLLSGWWLLGWLAQWVFGG